MRIRFFGDLHIGSLQGYGRHSMIKVERKIR